MRLDIVWLIICLFIGLPSRSACNMSNEARNVKSLNLAEQWGRARRDITLSQLMKLDLVTNSSIRWRVALPLTGCAYTYVPWYFIWLIKPKCVKVWDEKKKISLQLFCFCFEKLIPARNDIAYVGSNWPNWRTVFANKPSTGADRCALLFRGGCEMKVLREINSFVFSFRQTICSTSRRRQHKKKVSEERKVFDNFLTSKWDTGYRRP